MNNTNNGQMELSFGHAPAGRRSRRAHRLPGAQWWFAQMRAAVERAPDWQNNPPLGPAPAAGHADTKR